MKRKIDSIHWIYRSVIPALVFALLFITNGSFAQLSPGDLADPHAHLEGLSNCTECHVLGSKITNSKCLDCHKPLKIQIDKKKGYHSSKEIAGKDCISCHSDHHGRKFDMIRFDKDAFDHLLTGYELKGAHDELKCQDCHKSEFIRDNEIKKKKTTYLGMGTECLSCHTDYHQETLSKQCTDCHDFKAFEPAPKFNHKNTDFELLGKHKEVDCIECHEMTSRNGEEFQKFTDIEFESCTNCHEDVHKNKFGQNCTKCHDENSFNTIKGMSDFDHNTTNYKLENLHQLLECKDCHKTKLTDPLKHKLCTDCHEDYHEGQLSKESQTQDCKDCHSTKGFVGSSFTIELHNKLDFVLEGAHVATPCFVCHKEKEKWSFKDIGTNCADCHDDIHNSFIDEKYYPQKNCESCHTVNWWAEINFDHSKTEYELKGKHQKQSCRSCHFKPLGNGTYTQNFSNLNTNCTECHEDEHQKQFEINKETDCFRCHTNNDWKAEKFDHNNTLFALDGKHIDVACSECHQEKQIGLNTFVQYKLKNFKCEDCH